LATELDERRDFSLILAREGGSEKVEKNLRASLVAAGAATVLSALVGVIAGVGFFTLFIRAVVCGIFIGAIVYGAILLLQKTVPGILTQDQDPTPSEAYGGDDILRGANVDIVLPGEEASSQSFVSGEESRRDRADALPFGDRAPVLAAFTAKRGSESILGGEEAADLSPIAEASLLEPEGLGSDADAALPSEFGAERGAGSSGGIDDLDVLPDLESYSDSFNASEFASGGSSSNSGSKGNGGHGASATRPGQEGLDPVSIAQAVRTILKRDQKG
jgi:hypothetical protein